MPSSGSRTRILAVDDDPVILRLLSGLLVGAGYEVVGCTSAREASAALEAGGFSLLITDLHMPDGNGLDLTRNLRKHDERLPVILFSGSIAEETVRSAQDLGRVTCMSKPLDQEPFLRLVREALAAADPG